MSRPRLAPGIFKFQFFTNIFPEFQKGRLARLARLAFHGKPSSPQKRRDEGRGTGETHKYIIFTIPNTPKLPSKPFLLVPYSPVKHAVALSAAAFVTMDHRVTRNVCFLGMKTFRTGGWKHQIFGAVQFKSPWPVGFHRINQRDGCDKHLQALFDTLSPMQRR